MKKAQQMINDATMNFSGMADTARRIETLSTMMLMLAEEGKLDEHIAEDSAAVIGDLATNLRHMIDEAQTTAFEIEQARIVADMDTDKDESTGA